MIRQGMPSPSVPFLAPDLTVSSAWFPFLVALFERTGGAQGVDVTVLQQAVAGAQTSASNASDDAWLIEDSRLSVVQMTAQPAAVDPSLSVLLLQSGR